MWLGGRREAQSSVLAWWVCPVEGAWVCPTSREQAVYSLEASRTDIGSQG